MLKTHINTQNWFPQQVVFGKLSLDRLGRLEFEESSSLVEKLN